MPRRDHRKLKTQKLTSDGTQATSPNTLKSEIASAKSSILDDVSDAIPDMVESIMTKIDASLDSPGFKQSKLEKEVYSIGDDVESIKFDVAEILRQLPPRERRKPDSLGDVLNNIFSGNMDVLDENITFGNTPHARISGSSTSYTVPNTKWSTTIGKIEEDSDSDSDTDDISDSDSDVN